MVDTTPDSPIVTPRGPLQGEDIPWHARVRVLLIWLALAIFVWDGLTRQLKRAGRLRRLDEQGK